MLRKEMTKTEIEKELAGKGDYVLIDNITRFLKENLPTDIRKFVYMRLSEVYERGKIMISIKECYKNQAQLYEKEKRRNRAVKTYEKLLTLNISDAEKDGINKKLLLLYKELGMIDEYMGMRSRLGV